MRIIDADVLLEALETWGGSVEALHEYIENMPLAYNVDKVVEELEDMSGIEWHCPDCGYSERDKNFIYLPKAIEIVKGGKNDKRRIDTDNM